MATIWRFEKKFVESCSLVLDETLKLLACDLPHSLFLVGIHTKTNAVTIIPDNAVVADYELADVLVDSISENYAPYPDDDTLPAAEWNPLFQEHEWSCCESWRQIRDALASLLLDTDHESAVSPCCEVNEYVVALVATYSKAGYRRYPSLDMNVFTEHGRTPSLLFGAIEAVLNKFADELRKHDAGGRYENDPPNARDILRTAGAFFTTPEYTHGRESNSPRAISGFGELWSCSTPATSSLRCHTRAEKAWAGWSSPIGNTKQLTRPFACSSRCWPPNTSGSGNGWRCASARCACCRIHCTSGVSARSTKSGMTKRSTTSSGLSSSATTSGRCGISTST